MAVRSGDLHSGEHRSAPAGDDSSGRPVSPAAPPVSPTRPEPPWLRVLRQAEWWWEGRTASLARQVRRRVRMRHVVAALIVVTVVAIAGDGTAGPRGGPAVVPGAQLWADPQSVAAKQAAALRPTDAAGADALDTIAQQPQADWYGDWVPTGQLAAEVHERVGYIQTQGRLPVLVLYDIVDRDCGLYSKGGATTAAGYRAFVDQFAKGIRTGPAAVIVEPDALSHLDECGLSPAGRAERLDLIHYAVTTLAALPKVAVYLEAGSSNWHSAQEIADRLLEAGIKEARGFALNVSDFKWTQDVVAFGKQVSAKVGGLPFVVDTSRNGLGPYPGTGQDIWCNSPGRALGRPPTTQTGDPDIDAYLWIKHPGQSDGECGHGDPASGQWFQSYAIGLAQRVPPNDPNWKGDFR